MDKLNISNNILDKESAEATTNQTPSVVNSVNANDGHRQTETYNVDSVRMKMMNIGEEILPYDCSLVGTCAAGLGAVRIHVAGVDRAFTGSACRPVVAHSVLVHAGKSRRDRGRGRGRGWWGRLLLVLALDAPLAANAGVSAEGIGPGVQGAKAVPDGRIAARRVELDRRACGACLNASGIDAAGITGLGASISHEAGILLALPDGRPILTVCLETPISLGIDAAIGDGSFGLW